MNALKHKPVEYDETTYLLDIYRRLNDFNESVVEYCYFVRINNIDERLYLLDMMRYIRSLYLSDED